MVTAFVALYLTLRLPKVKCRRPEHTAQRLETLSAFLLLASVATPLFALNLGGEIFPWSHPAVVVPLCLTPLVAGLFYYADTHYALTPIIPRRFIQNRHIAIALACTLPMKFVFDQVRRPSHTMMFPQP